jgi:hypothetical protein
MKQLRYLCLILIFSFGKNIIYAQNIELPEKIDLFQYVVPNDDIYGFPDVRIWGWSTNGKTAYSVERNIEGRGGVSIQFIIFDLVEDTIDFEINVDSNDYNLDDYGGNTIMYLYNLNSEDINNAIRKNNIVYKKNIYSPLPGKIKNADYSCYSNIENEKEPEFYDKIKGYSIIVNRNNKSKTVKNTMDVEALSVYICGYFKSPFEDRILIVTAEEKWGFEGTELYYYFVGCHLERGF